MKIKSIAFITVFFLFMQILFFPIQTMATGETITIQCNDINFYNALVEGVLAGEIEEKDDTKKTITVSKETVEGLTALYIDDNEQTEDKKIKDITGIENFTSLKILNLSHNHISDLTPLQGLTTIENLSLGYNDITDITPLRGLTELYRLYLSDNMITDISPIAELTKLEDLYIGYNAISDMSVIEDFNLEEMTVSLGYQTISTSVMAGGIKEVELPQILRAVKDSNSQLYAERDYELANCTLSADGTKIIIDTDQVTSATVEIDRGLARGTRFTVNVEEPALKLEVEKSTTQPTNQNVTVTIKANSEIKEVEGWRLSEEKNSLTKEYTQNTEETVQVEDLEGNTATVEIKIDNIDKVAPELTVNYEEKDDEIKVMITPNEEIQIPQGWQKEAGNLTIYKEYTSNVEEVVSIKDLAGNTTEVSIKIENLKPNGTGTQNNGNTTNNRDNTVINSSLPKTGIRISILAIACIIVLYGIFVFHKYRKYRGI